MTLRYTSDLWTPSTTHLSKAVAWRQLQQNKDTEVTFLSLKCSHTVSHVLTRFNFSFHHPNCPTNGLPTLWAGHALSQPVVHCRLSPGLGVMVPQPLANFPFLYPSQTSPPLGRFPKLSPVLSLQNSAYFLLPDTTTAYIALYLYLTIFQYFLKDKKHPLCPTRGLVPKKCFLNAWWMNKWMSLLVHITHRRRKVKNHFHVQSRTRTEIGKCFL